MKGVVFRGDRKLEILDFDDPTPGPLDAIIEMKASGMCGSDLHFYRNKPADVIKSLGFRDLASRGMSEDTPIIGGHEPCGQIVALGAAVDPRACKVGDRVAVFHYEGCQHCDYCRSGWTQMCSHGADIHGVIKHGVDVDKLFTDRWKLEQAEEACRLFDGQAGGKDVFLF